MIRLSRYSDPATVIGEPRRTPSASASDRAAGLLRMRADLVRIKAQLWGHGAKPAWFVERYGVWPSDAIALLAELGARKIKLGCWKL